MIEDCLGLLKRLPEASVDLVITSPPYDGQPKYGNDERYERGWYEGFFLDLARRLTPLRVWCLRLRSRDRHPPP